MLLKRHPWTIGYFYWIAMDGGFGLAPFEPISFSLVPRFLVELRWLSFLLWMADGSSCKRAPLHPLIWPNWIPFSLFLSLLLHFLASMLSVGIPHPHTNGYVQFLFKSLHFPFQHYFGFLDLFLPFPHFPIFSPLLSFLFMRFHPFCMFLTIFLFLRPWCL